MVNLSLTWIFINTKSPTLNISGSSESLYSHFSIFQYQSMGHLPKFSTVLKELKMHFITCVNRIRIK